MDVAPTLLELVGLPPLPAASGTALVATDAGVPGRPLFSTRFYQNGHHRLALRLGQWKLHVKAPVSSTTARDPLGLHSKDIAAGAELYDLRSDTLESKNVADAHSEIVDMLLEHARAWQLDGLRRMAQEDRTGPWSRREPHLDVDPRTAEELRGFGYSLDASGR